MRRVLLLSVPLLLAVAGCRGGNDLVELEPDVPALSLTSAAFDNGGPIPIEFTCDGADRSIPLDWGALPPLTESVVIIMDDPDAPGGRFTHWFAWNLPSTSTGVAAGASGAGLDAVGAAEGINDFGRRGYGGPCPPKDHDAHRYEVRVYALDAALFFGSDPSRKALVSPMEGHVLAFGLLLGTYDR